MNEIGMLACDENNNEDQQNATTKSKRIGVKTSGFYVERHLDLGTESDDFLIIPNGGSGDCMFKAVSQAVYNGDESKHREIRKRVVNYIISQRWEKFSESIEVQHINGNNLLQRQWAKDPKDAYKMYMTMSGTLGSSSELTATGEVFHFNFATIQEYCSSTQSTYRVENCLMSEDAESDFHYFYFTGDYDNGHWEYIKNLSGKKLEDGTYQGSHRIVINGEQISFEEWLKRETSNTNDADLLKIATNHSIFTRRRTAHPFELKCYQFCRDGTVRLKGCSFTIAPVQCSDLFSVLAFECLKNETSAHDIELILMKHRYSYFEDLNYKLITQPWSHNFTIDALRYCAQSLKGNIQDLIAAADLYSFSFILFLKMSDEGDTHQCKFTHVDRWGGESDRILYFFMRLSRSNKGEQEQLIAKWWRLNPVDNNSPVTSANNAKSLTKKSVARLQTTGLVPNVPKPSDLCVMKRSVTADSYSSKKSVSRAATPRPSTVHGGIQEFQTPHENFRGASSAHELDRFEFEKLEPKCQVLQGGITVRKISDSEGGMETDECFKRDQERLFGARPLSRKSSALAKSSSSSKNTARLIKKDFVSNQRIKPATGRDLLKHPEKVKTVVKIRDKTNSGRELTYRGSGYMKADDVLYDLKNQGIIRIPTPRPGRASSYTGTRSKLSDIIVPRIRSADARQRYNSAKDELLALRDENFNVIVEECKEDEENEGSDVSYEDFAASVAKAARLEEDNVSEQEVSVSACDDNWRLQVNKGQQFPPQDLFPAAMAYSKNKLNKVMPGQNQVCPEPQNPYNRKGYDYYKKYKNMDDQYEERDTCINRLTHAFERLVAGLRKLTRRIRDNITRRYEGYSRPPSRTNNAKRTKQFPRRKMY